MMEIIGGNWEPSTLWAPVSKTSDLIINLIMTETNQKAPSWEKYFDPAQNLPYYFNPATEECVWEQPKDVNIVDMTE